MSISSTLNVAKAALIATQTSVQVASNNIANVNTVGYARQEAVLEDASPNGVCINTIMRYYDKYLESSMRGKNSNAGEQSVLSTYLNRIEGVVNEDNSNLSNNLTAFFNDWQSLSTDPTNKGLKQTLVSQGQTLAQSVDSIYADLKGLQTEANSQINSDIASINGMLSSIADLNKRIIESSGNVDSGSGKNGYLDQKTALLDKLSRKMGITTFDDEYGRTTVLTTSGKPLVEDGGAWSLTTIADGTTGYSNVAWKDTTGDVTDITGSIGGGEIKALIDTRDKYTPEFLTAMDDLSNALKGNVKWSVNGISTSFFQGTSGADIAVSQSLVNDPTLISATSDPVNNPTDNDIAVAMASLADEKLLDGGTSTFTDFLANLAGRAGQVASNAKDAAQYTSDTLSALSSQRASISGVSIDDEMTNLIKFQYAYQAASRLFTVADTLLQDLMKVIS